MSKLFLLCSIICLSTSVMLAQTNNPVASGGEIEREASECVSHTQRTEIVKKLKANTKRLQKEGKLSTTPKRMLTSFEWPLQQAPGFNYNSYYSVYNFVDHNPNPGALEDYDCGERTYDLTNYDHRGTDILLWPFGWHMLDDEQVEVIAAAAGTIILKEDGNPNTNCDFSDPNWNAIYIEHADGSVAWYGHLKSGTLNAKGVGDNVVTGEYLGIVASSGSSTYPHLHFEIWEDNTYTNLIDPYAGPCNDLNTNSWWANQKPYREPTLNHLMTNSACPQFNTCPAPADINAQDVFLQGSSVFFSIYLHDQLQGHVTDLRILQPNGVEWSSWSHVSPDTYNDSWWCWFWNFPGTEPLGDWTFEVTYQGDVFTTDFTIMTTLPVELNAFTAKRNGATIDLEWETKTEVNNDFFELQKSRDGIDFSAIAKLKGSGTTTHTNTYATVDAEPYDGINYYRLEQFDFDGSSIYSNVINVDFESSRGTLPYPNPVIDNYVYLNNAHAKKDATLSVYDVNGSLLLSEIPIVENNQKVDLENLPHGVLLFKIEQEESIEYFRVLYME